MKSDEYEKQSELKTAGGLGMKSWKSVLSGQSELALRSNSSLEMFLLFDLTMTNNATVVKHDVKEIYNHVNSKHIFINFLFSEIETYKIQSGFSRKECFLYIHICCHKDTN